MSECCVVQIPGPRGAAGDPGTDGTDGINAFTLTTAEFTVPPVGDPVDVFVVEESWASPNGSAVNGQVVHVQFAGYFYVESAPDGGPLTLVNLGYDGNAAPGTIVPPSSKVSPGGLIGPTGAATVGALLAVNNLGDVDDIPTALINLGIGTAGIEDKGNALNEIPFVNDPAGLTNGESVWATAFGLETVNAADARTRLGIVPVTADTYSLIIDQKADGIDGGNFVATTRQPRVLNTTVADTGPNVVSIVGNQIELTAGTYRIRASAPAFGSVLNHKIRLQNVTTPTTLLVGTSEYAATIQTRSFLNGRFTVAAAQKLELQHWGANANAGDGMGQATGSGDVEVYAMVELAKE